MSSLHQLQNPSRPTKGRKRVGRGPGSGLGKTSGRGVKGEGSRSGYRRRYGKEGGQFPLYMKLPTRGFTRGRFLKRLDTINLGQIENLFSDGDTVNLESLRDRGLISGKSHGLKVLAEGELTKKVRIEADAASAGAKEKLERAGIELVLPSAEKASA